jgi:hypothetical protein
MPGFDRTGPLGRGPGTGWGQGLCARPSGGRRLSFSGALRGVGRGGLPWGGGRGRCFGGRGWRSWGSWAGGQVPAPDEAEMLRAELAAAKEEIAAMKARLSELDQKED